ncbi:MAG: class I SAM-dependent methyltransferase [Kiloniellaceae bacterium]
MSDYFAHRPAPSAELGFFLLWLRRPLHVGAMVPSGRVLAASMAAAIDRAAPGTVVELGGGTGSITRALLKAGVPADNLLVVEREPALCRIIEERCPGARVVSADARDLGETLRAAGVDRVKAIVSGLPLLSMESGERRAVLRAAFGALPPGAEFLQFTYGFGAPISERERAELGIVGARSQWVWLNLPPAAIWRFRHGDTNARKAT